MATKKTTTKKFSLASKKKSSSASFAERTINGYKIKIDKEDVHLIDENTVSMRTNGPNGQQSPSVYGVRLPSLGMELHNAVLDVAPRSGVKFKNGNKLDVRKSNLIID